MRQVSSSFLKHQVSHLALKVFDMLLILGSHAIAHLECSDSFSLISHASARSVFNAFGTAFYNVGFPIDCEKCYGEQVDLTTAYFCPLTLRQLLNQPHKVNLAQLIKVLFFEAFTFYLFHSDQLLANLFLKSLLLLQVSSFLI